MGQWGYRPLTCLKSLIQKTLAAIDIFIKMSIANAPSQNYPQSLSFYR